MTKLLGLGLWIARRGWLTLTVAAVLGAATVAGTVGATGAVTTALHQGKCVMNAAGMATDQDCHRPSAKKADKDSTRADKDSAKADKDSTKGSRSGLPTATATSGVGGSSSAPTGTATATPMATATSTAGTGGGTSSPTPAPGPLPPVSSSSVVPANMEYEGDNLTRCGAYDSASLTVPAVQGSVMDMTWRCIEPNAPVNGVHSYDFSAYDAYLQAWASHGKKIALVFRYVNGYSANCSFSNPQSFMPAWEEQNLQSVGHLVCDQTQRSNLPDWFDSSFIANLQAVEQAIGTHFATSPYRNAIVYKRFGTGVGGEGYPVLGGAASGSSCGSMSCWQQMLNWGLSGTCTNYSWLHWAEARLTEDQNYLAGIPGPLVHGINVLQDANGKSNGGNGCLDPVTGQAGETYPEMLAYWGASHGIGIGYQALQPGFTYAEAPTISAYVTKHWPHTFHQFQPQNGGFGPSQGMIATAFCYGGGNGGTPGTTTSTVQQGASTIEWYHQTVDSGALSNLMQTYSAWQTGAATAPSGTCNGL